MRRRADLRHSVQHPLQMTVAVADGERVWVFPYSSAGASRSLFVSAKVETLRALHPDVSFVGEISDETRLVVSEPLGELPRAWKEVPESSCGIVQPGQDVLLPFHPVGPPAEGEDRPADQEKYVLAA